MVSSASDMGASAFLALLYSPFSIAPRLATPVSAVITFLAVFAFFETFVWTHASGNSLEQPALHVALSDLPDVICPIWVLRCTIQSLWTDK